MFKGHPVTAITPAGRKQYLEVLAPYILRDRHIFDEWMIWVNTPHKEDIEYIQRLRDSFPGFVRLVFHAGNITRKMPQPHFFPTACDPGRLYIKFDDDICYVHENAVNNLLEFRLREVNPLIVVSNTVCNGICSYLHQKHGAQTFHINGKYERIAPDFDNKVGVDARFAEYTHKTFIDDYFKGEIQKYLFDQWVLEFYQRIAINCIAWTGDDFAKFNGLMDDHYDEEAWLCSIKPRDGDHKNSICGNSLVSHFAFYRHRKPFCSGPEIDNRILRAYRLISMRECPKEAREVFSIDVLPATSEKAIRNAMVYKLLI